MDSTSISRLLHPHLGVVSSHLHTHTHHWFTQTLLCNLSSFVQFSPCRKRTHTHCLEMCWEALPTDCYFSISSWCGECTYTHTHTTQYTCFPQILVLLSNFASFVQLSPCRIRRWPGQLYLLDATSQLSDGVGYSVGLWYLHVHVIVISVCCKLLFTQYSLFIFQLSKCATPPCWCQSTTAGCLHIFAYRSVEEILCMYMHMCICASSP